MEKTKTREKLLKMLEIAPPLREIILSGEALDEKRRRAREFLTAQLTLTYSDDPEIPPLEWILARESISMLRGFLLKRNERLAGFSFFGYVNDLVSGADAPPPSRGFLAELEHLLLGVMRKTDVYSAPVAAFTRHHGRKAARMRSRELSRLAERAGRFMERYACGLDEDAVRRRRANRRRILSFFGGSDADWENWRWHLRHTIHDVENLADLIDLADEEYRAVELAREWGIPFAVTPYYLSLIDRRTGGARDRAVRAQVIPTLHYVETMKRAIDDRECSMDFMLERDTSPVDGITRRYPMIVILKPVTTCPQICVYCQRNWELVDPRSSHAVLSEEKLEAALEWIDREKEIREVLVTGGDPLMLSTGRIERLLSRLARIDHVERIRIGTRTLVTLPQRVDEDLADRIGRFNRPGRREVVIVTHFEHPYEITPEATEAVQRFRRRGLEVCNQMVFTFFNSRRFEATLLRHKLRLAGVDPYYTFSTKGKEETADYRVPIARLLQEQTEEARLMPGMVRTDEVVFNVPKLGKNYLRAGQNHSIISVLPDGRRLYEFHPWEKKLALADTYTYADVSIYDYLKRLRRIGEHYADYRTIWYYY